jgi:hypothetical protein
MERGGLSMQEFETQMKADAKTQVATSCFLKMNLHLAESGAISTVVQVRACKQLTTCALFRTV